MKHQHNTVINDRMIAGSSVLSSHLASLDALHYTRELGHLRVRHPDER